MRRLTILTWHVHGSYLDALGHSVDAHALACRPPAISECPNRRTISAPSTCAGGAEARLRYSSDSFRPMPRPTNVP